MLMLFVTSCIYCTHTYIDAVTWVYSINLSIRSKCVPDTTKRSKEIPLFKKNSKLQVGNYSPVSVLTSISKVLEKAVHIPGFSVTAPWAFNWFLDGNENKVDISIVGTNGKFFLINAHGVLRRMGAATEIPGTS